MVAKGIVGAFFDMKNPQNKAQKRKNGVATP